MPPSRHKTRMGRSASTSGRRKPPKEVFPKKKEHVLQSSLYHSFTSQETEAIRERLLAWYDKCKRDLPWRTTASTEPDLDRKAYAVWVSEVMLQQTQVATVINYYNKWMKVWPTVEDLARASLEEVNEMWSGLGYYSRGRRLQEGAKKVVSELGGSMPRSADELQKLLPGVGRYTAGAIASISYEQVTGVVDGNVIRVLSRMRCIGADSSTPAVSDKLWDLANALVDPERPGDFNQGMMELGATVCTPKKPLCTECPLQGQCKAFLKVNAEKEHAVKTLIKKQAVLNAEDVGDIEECDLGPGSCALCVPSSDPWDSSLGVANFPRKSAKKPSRVEQTATCVWEKCGDRGELEYLIVQRPSSGLLAGMWEFPSILLHNDLTEKDQKHSLLKLLQDLSGHSVPLKKLQYKGEVVHIFSHIHQTYMVYFLSKSTTENFSVKIEETEHPQTRWVTKEQFLNSAIPTAMKKIMKLCESPNSSCTAVNRSKKRKGDIVVQLPSARIKSEMGKQQSIQSFFKLATKK
ncbi:adenine DNA glycosylase isoform X2 [Xenopus laevis]|uniref:Adenine DNA glycosylase n=2 Tax=Xenopus laevis TaxID=8355 RepID=A0A8J0V207_XENLA|nr:adenine DNA glycosylase isoform X2 [Xenopus laevis]